MYTKDTNLSGQIEIQRAKLLQGNPNLLLSEVCRIGNGISVLTDEAKAAWISAFNEHKTRVSIAYFIPASGSGSRMFDTLYNFLQTDNPDSQTIEFVEHLLNCAPDFAFYELLPHSIKTDLKTGAIDLKNFIRLLLFSDKMADQHTGFNYGNLPKGLIPFHRYGDKITNPFQEHILQGIEISGPDSVFHFTINETFKRQINQSIEKLISGRNIKATRHFSVQNPATDAIAFDENLNPAVDEKGSLITRPSGHGALLENLNAVKANLIFIRNIDNIQHQSKSTHSIKSRMALGGIALHLRTEIFSILTLLEEGSIPVEKIKALNAIFDLRVPVEKMTDVSAMIDFFDRPLRVCGMVKNEGQPGGGPFWVKDKTGTVRRQIVEKSQISNLPEQLEILIKSTHFNPVELVCSTQNFKGTFFDLKNFRNDDLYFIVQKNHQGKFIQYIEEPGLWNGGMDKWLTLFYEIESDCFSPVKTVLDLLKPLHRE
ncbi:MAG: DUF4301 family protein [Bacteroidetes bacterium]|nr:DUF4301 family protein [Bacteroidota bacterium]